jgi:hypothetical protein
VNPRRSGLKLTLRRLICSNQYDIINPNRHAESNEVLAYPVIPCTTGCVGAWIDCAHLHCPTAPNVALAHRNHSAITFDSGTQAPDSSASLFIHRTSIRPPCFQLLDFSHYFLLFNISIVLELSIVPWLQAHADHVFLNQHSPSS